MLKVLCRNIIIGLCCLPVSEAVAKPLKHESELPNSVKAAWQSGINQCSIFDGDLIEVFGGTEVDVSLIGKTKTADKFYLLPCGSPGAYNFPAIGIYYFKEENAAQIVAFPAMQKDGPTTVELIFNVDWDEKKQQLSSRVKGRGVGDCGSSSIWKWNTVDYIASFVLIEQRTKDDCDGVFDEWPLVWPLKSSN